MYTIRKKENLAEQIYRMEVEAMEVAAACLPGQFVIVRVTEDGERIPLTICDYDREAGTITIVFQVVGASTYKMAKLEEGDSFTDFVGPLGCPSDFTKNLPESGKVVFIAGGVGAAPVYVQAKYLKEHGVEADVLMGARRKDLLIFEKEFEAVSHLYVCTDDGSKGFKGNTGDLFNSRIAGGCLYNHCVAIGPMRMMQAICQKTKEVGLATTVSLNPIMVDGTGMCGACRVTVGGQVRFACVDGPEFDGHQVDFEEAIRRQSVYRTEEGRRYLKEKEGDSYSGHCGYCGGEA